MTLPTTWSLLQPLIIFFQDSPVFSSINLFSSSANSITLPSTCFVVGWCIQGEDRKLNFDFIWQSTFFSVSAISVLIIFMHITVLLQTAVPSVQYKFISWLTRHFDLVMLNFLALFMPFLCRFATMLCSLLIIYGGFTEKCSRIFCPAFDITTTLFLTCLMCSFVLIRLFIH